MKIPLPGGRTLVLLVDRPNERRIGTTDCTYDSRDPAWRCKVHHRDIGICYLQAGRRST